MYIPPHFAETNPQQLLAFMQQYPFATLITAQNNLPFATHLPFVAELRGETIVLLSHMAKNNPQHRQFMPDAEALVVFQEPHAYVSPRHYEKLLNVPTWNYVAVHAYGTPRLLTHAPDALALIEKMLHYFEAEYVQQWNQLPDAYKNGLLNGIAAFEITATRIEGKKKLSQNKTEKERQNIITAFSNSPDAPAQQIAGFMQQL
ncbi:FMN-binding negative transcriptional regulator [Sphingobacteriales bacterium UPWRP_1]|nr:hypothetical protein BVG80_07795 [Sphingobacteriales bacterium TSM_CSM]PSJ73701.1 FMN-binding negative transcriptional regulator [Sphingobacteriales bacterium UPWRP_1]